MGVPIGNLHVASSRLTKTIDDDGNIIIDGVSYQVPYSEEHPVDELANTVDFTIITKS